MNKNQQSTAGEQTGQPNPTLNQPGSQVADYGNPTGGSANTAPEGDHLQANPERSGDESRSGDTLGNP